METGLLLVFLLSFLFVFILHPRREEIRLIRFVTSYDMKHVAKCENENVKHEKEGDRKKNGSSKYVKGKEKNTEGNVLLHGVDKMAYALMVKKAIERTWEPEEVGLVKVKLVVDREGRAVEVDVLNSTSRWLEEEVLEAIKLAQPFPPPSHPIMITVEFKSDEG